MDLRKNILDNDMEEVKPKHIRINKNNQHIKPADSGIPTISKNDRNNKRRKKVAKIII